MPELNTISFQVVPSPDTNDHEVKIFVDGQDFIARHWPDMMGMDPDEVLSSYHALLPRNNPHDATVVRCGCGIIGCGSASVRISGDTDHVIWEVWQGDRHKPPTRILVFDRSQYMQAVKDAVEDHSWETPDRTAARILSSIVDHSALKTNNLKYEWASGRIREATLTISLRGPQGYQQILLHVPWDKQSPEQIAREAAHLLKSDPNQWSDVVWQGEKSNPPFSGPAWRKADTALW
jgi:hypothetical protein